MLTFVYVVAISFHEDSLQRPEKNWIYLVFHLYSNFISNCMKEQWIIKETSTQMYTPFYFGLINNMDHMRISGTEPSSVILNQTK